METVKRLLGLEELQAKHAQLVERLNILTRGDLTLVSSRHTDTTIALKDVRGALLREEQTLERLNKQIEELQRLENALPELERQLSELSQRISLRENHIKTLQQQEANLHAKLEKLENKALTMGKNAKSFETCLETQLAYKLFSENQLALQINQKLLEKDKQSALKLQETITSYRNQINVKPQLEQQVLECSKRVDALRAEIKRLQKLESELRGRKEELEKEAAKIQAEIREVENELRNR